MKVEKINTIILTSQEVIENITKNSKEMKQTIEEAAEAYRRKLIKDVITLNADIDFIAGAKSEAAKNHWQEGMFSEEDMRSYVTFYIKQQWKGELKYLGRDLLKVWKEENGKS